MPRKNDEDGSSGGGELAPSMRPRPDAAEKREYTRNRRGAVKPFNEAAARCRGKTRGRDRRRGGRRTFNEAAARCRGKTNPKTRKATYTYILQ